MGAVELGCERLFGHAFVGTLADIVLRGRLLPAHVAFHLAIGRHAQATVGQPDDPTENVPPDNCAVFLGDELIELRHFRLIEVVRIVVRPGHVVSGQHILDVEAGQFRAQEAVA